MRKKSTQFYVALIVLGLCLVSAWAFRYHQVNQFYKQHSLGTKEFFSMNEEISFEDDFLALHESAPGHWICVNQLEIVDFADYISLMGLSTEGRETITPDKLALVSITLQNADGPVSDIFLPNFSLFGTDSNPQLDYEIMCDINPSVLENSWYVSFQKEARCDIILPYMLFQENYKHSVWNNFDQYPFYLQITAFPTAKYVRLES